MRGKEELDEAGDEEGGRSEVSEVSTRRTSRNRENLDRRETVESKAKE